jgi:hypothetical protein
VSTSPSTHTHKLSEKFFTVLKCFIFGWKNNEVKVKEIIISLEANVAGVPVLVYNAKPS